MIAKTKGIVFHQIKYSETSLIVKIYTREFGLLSYLMKGIRSKKSKIHPILLQHLSLLDLVVHHNKKNNIQHIREVQSAHHYKNLPFNIIKSSIIIFINELLVKSIREEESNSSLFDFIFRSIQWLDLSENNFVNFHLIFTMQLTRFLGFYPQGSYTNKNLYFNLEEGCFENIKPIHSNILKNRSAQLFSELTQYSFETMGELKLKNENRNMLLDQMINYYQLHLPNFGELKSLEVLRTVFS